MNLPILRITEEKRLKLILQGELPVIWVKQDLDLIIVIYQYLRLKRL